jgi:hypothetical protein
MSSKAKRPKSKTPPTKSARAPAYKPPLRNARATRVGGVLRLPRAAKGKRAQFYADPAIDQLMAISAALAAELSVAFERIHTLEQVLAKQGQLDRSVIEEYEPDDAEAGQRASAREALLERVFQVLEVTDPIR